MSETTLSIIIIIKIQRNNKSQRNNTTYNSGGNGLHAIEEQTKLVRREFPDTVTELGISNKSGISTKISNPCNYITSNIRNATQPERMKQTKNALTMHLQLHICIAFNGINAIGWMWLNKHRSDQRQPSFLGQRSRNCNHLAFRYNPAND